MARRQAPRPKRGGEEFARSHYAEDASTSKKVRFGTRNPAALPADAPEDDAVLDADVIGRRGAQVKRSAVNIDGYDSDSSNDGFDKRANEKAQKNGKASKDEEDDDMFADIEEKEFADGDEDEDLRKEGKKRKDVEFADNIGDDEDGDPEIQSSKSGGHVSADILLKPERYGRSSKVESDSESSEDDEEGRAALDGDVDEEVGAGGKKTHAPRLDAFNMKEERKDGAIDENLNYIRKATDPDAVYDNWLEGTSKKDMRIAKEAHERRERERRAKDQEDDEILTAEILRKLIPYLEMGETSMEALARLGRGKPKAAKVPKWKQKKKKASAMDVDVGQDGDGPAEEDEAETKRRQAVEAITDAADRLMGRGEEDIYEQERELLTRLYKRETGENWVDAPTDSELADEAGKRLARHWHYRWADGRDGGGTHGPYDGATMDAWNGAGYFGDGVEFQMVGDESSGWSRSVQFT